MYIQTLRRFTLLALSIGLLFGGLAHNTVAQNLGEEMDKAIEMLRSLDNPDQSAIQAMLGSAAMGYYQSKDYDKAMARVIESLKLAKETNQTTNLAVPLQTATKILKASGDDNASNTFLMTLLKESGDNIEFKKAILNVLGNNSLYSGDLVFSMIAYHEKLQIIREENPDSLEEANALFDYGQACVLGKLFDLAAPALNRAEELALKFKDFDLASSVNYQKGSALFQIEEYQLAKDLYKKQLQLANESKDKVGINAAVGGLISSHLCLNEIEEARELALESYPNAASNMDKGQISAQLAVIELLIAEPNEKTYLNAIQLCQRALKEKKLDLPIPAIAAQATIGDQLLLASVAIQADNLELASQALAKAERGVQQLRKSFQRAARFGEVQSDVANVGLSYYEDDISNFRQQLLVKQQKYVEALMVAENGRASAQQQLLKIRLGVKRVKDAGRLDVDKIIELAKTQNKHILFYSLIRAFDHSVQTSLPATHPLRHPTNLYVWLIKPDGGYEFRNVPLRGSVDALVGIARNQIRPPAQVPTEQEKEKPEVNEDSGEKNEKRSSQQTVGDSDKKENEGFDAVANLGSVLIDPISDALPDDINAHLVLVPQGSLFNVPFAALPVAEDVPLIEKYTVSVVPSLEVLNLVAVQQESNREKELEDILIVGNPSMPSYQFRPDKPPAKLTALKGAEREAEILGEMLKVKPWIGDEATEVSVVEKMKSSRIIHLATHGSLEAENVFSQAYLSAVALAPGDGEDGFLTVRETMQLDLSADLVVLSACDTGLGKITGDGVVGLTRGFFSAGVPTVVASLWPVSDLSAGYLMVTYHSALAAGKDKATALRIAMLETRKKFPEPRDWAAFSVYGLAQ